MRQDDPLRLLMISSSWNETEVLTNHLRNAGYTVRLLRVADEKRLTMVLRDQDWDLLLHLPDAPDLEIATTLALLSESHKDIPVIMVADMPSPAHTLALFDAGVSDIVPPEPTGLLLRTVRRELEGLRVRRRLHVCQKDLQAIEQRCLILLNSTKDAVAYVQEGMHILANPAYLHIFLFSNADEVIGVPLLDVVDTSAHPLLKNRLRTVEQADSAMVSLETHAVRTNGQRFPARIELTPTILEGEPCIQVMIHDHSPTPVFQQHVDQGGRLDAWTGLYNRSSFLEELDRTLPQHPGILYLSVDNQAALREQVGWAGTDRLFKEIADRLVRHAQPNDRVAHFGDGVFVLFTTDGEEARLRALSEAIRKALDDAPIEVGENTLRIESSMGLHPAYLHAKDSDTALSRLEAAANIARQSGGKQAVVCPPELPTAPSIIEPPPISEPAPAVAQPPATPTPAVGNLLSAALDRNKLFLVYQPIVYLGGDGRELYEVFPRIIGSGGGHPIPEQVMQIVDARHLPSATDRWTIARALDVLAERQVRDSKATQVWIALSRDTLLDESFPAWLEGKLRTSCIPASALIVQIQHTLAAEDHQRIRDFVPAVHNLGCGVALSHCRGDARREADLQTLDVDYIRVEGAIIQDLATNRQHQALLKGINERIHALEKRTLVDSVRDANTLTILWQYGVDYIQGEYLQKQSDTMSYDFSSMFVD